LKRLLLVALACGAAWGADPFSHRLHLGIGLRCEECHTAAAASTNAQDNLLPARQVCRGCHKEDELPAIGQRRVPTRVTKFSHALHLKMGDVAPFIAAAIDRGNYLQPPGDIRRRLNTGDACEACHRGLEDSDQVTAAALPRMADCLVCHTVIEPPFSCEDCHARDARLEPPNHTQIPHFMDAHSSGKLKLDKTTCAVCHGRTFTCRGCH